MLGYIVFVLVGVQFLVADLIQRIVVGPLIWARPGAREQILTGWAQGLRRLLFGLVEGIGRARFDVRARIPAAAGTLVVMNHQSLLDIPVGTRMVPDGYARFVLRARYTRGVPLISHMSRLYRHPSVSPGQRNRGEFDAMRDAALSSQQPILIFPEGHRTRDGEIGRWRTGGVRALLRARKWSVYVAVLDGVWETPSIAEFVRNLSSLRCRTDVAGPFPFDPDRDDPEAFIAQLRTVMCDKLAQLRAEPK